MAQSAARSIPQPIVILVIPLSELLPWAIFGSLLILLAIYFVGAGSHRAGIPASLMWRFRITALEIQVVMWATLGLLFGWLTERAQKNAQVSRLASDV